MAVTACTLILLPGMHGTDDLFGPFLPALPADQPRRVIAYPTDQILSYDDLVHHVERTISDAENLVMIGESFSGPVAIRFAARHPERVRAVVTLGSFVTPPLPTVLRWFVFESLFGLPITRVSVRLIVAGFAMPTAFVDTIRDAIRRPMHAVLAHRTRDVLSADTTDALLRFPGPILAIHGRQDHMVPLRNLSIIARHRPDATIHRMDGPHLLLQTHPRETWRVIHDFLVRHSLCDATAKAESNMEARSHRDYTAPAPPEEWQSGRLRRS